MAEVDTDVLIVGGGPVGLTCAILAASMGVRVLLVERRQAVSYYPKARALTARTLEIFRQMGVERAVHAAMPPGRTRHYAIAPDLRSSEIRLIPFGLGSLDPRDDTPCTGSFCPQDRLEPILAARLAREGGATSWFGTELTGYAQDEAGVAATVRRADGSETHVTARLLVAADGAQGRCAGLAGIGASDGLALDPALTVIFKAPLADRIDPLDSVYLLLGDPTSAFGGMVSGVSLARDPEEWSVVMTRLPEWGARLTPETEPRWQDAIRQLTGLDNLPVSISAVAEWRREAAVADRMVSGRVALAGDSAHLMPPAGGLGLNTGLQDAHNLAWRLAAVVKGADLALLDDYDRERRPEVARSVDAAVENYRQGANIDAIWNRPQVGLSLGVRYAEGSFVAEADAPLPDEYPHHDYMPSASPGGRAPHFWLDEAAGLSVLDLFGREFVLLAGSEDSPLCSAAARLAIACHVPEDRGWRDLYGIGAAGGVLVRPDGVVAWRSAEGGQAAFEDAYRTILRQKEGR